MPVTICGILSLVIAKNNLPSQWKPFIFEFFTICIKIYMTWQKKKVKSDRLITAPIDMQYFYIAHIKLRLMNLKNEKIVQAFQKFRVLFLMQLYIFEFTNSQYHKVKINTTRVSPKNSWSYWLDLKLFEVFNWSPELKQTAIWKLNWM